MEEGNSELTVIKMKMVKRYLLYHGLNHRVIESLSVSTLFLRLASIRYLSNIWSVYAVWKFHLFTKLESLILNNYN